MHTEGSRNNDCGQAAFENFYFYSHDEQNSET